MEIKILTREEAHNIAMSNFDKEYKKYFMKAMSSINTASINGYFNCMYIIEDSSFKAVEYIMDKLHSLGYICKSDVNEYDTIYRVPIPKSYKIEISW